MFRRYKSPSVNLHLRRIICRVFEESYLKYSAGLANRKTCFPEWVSSSNLFVSFVGLGMWFSLRVQEVPGSNPDLAQILYFITILFNIHPTIYFLFYTTYETKKVKKNDFFTWLHNQTNFKKSSIDYLGRLPLFATKMNAQRRSFPYRISIVPIHNNGLSLP